MWRSRLRVARIFSFLFPTIFLVASLGQIAVLYFGGVQIFDGTLTIGEWQKFSLYVMFVFFPMGQLGFIIGQMSQASASADRIFEILNTVNEVTDSPDATPLPPVQGKVEFRDVTFRYFNSSDPVLSTSDVRGTTGRDGGAVGCDGQRQDVDHQPDPPFL